MPFDFEADRRLAALHGYEPAGSSIEMIKRCATHGRGDEASFWELGPVHPKEPIPPSSEETLPVADSGARPDHRPLNESDAMWGE